MGRIFSYSKVKLVDEYKTSPHKAETLQLLRYNVQWGYYLARLMLKARTDRDVISCASVDFMHYSGFVTMGYFWLKMMDVAAAKLADNPSPQDRDFYEGKIQTGKFFFQNMLPRVEGHAAAMMADPKAFMVSVHPRCTPQRAPPPAGGACARGVRFVAFVLGGRRGGCCALCCRRCAIGGVLFRRTPMPRRASVGMSLSHARSQWLTSGHHGLCRKSPKRRCTRPTEATRAATSQPCIRARDA